MRLNNQELRERLAAEYVLGTLSGAVRSRFKQLLKYDIWLQRIVAAWEARLLPLAGTTPEIEPPAHVWDAIRSQIRGARTAPSPSEGRLGGEWRAPSAPRVGLWRTLAMAATALAAVLLLYIGLAPPPEAPISNLAVLSTKEGQPAMLVSWARAPQASVQVLSPHPPIEPGTSWELWLIPADKPAPISMGLVTAQPRQVIELPKTAVESLADAKAMALSVEPKGGSPTGQPTGPVILQGPALKLPEPPRA
jgi:anti-sigma-K factor RskA